MADEDLRKHYVSRFNAIVAGLPSLNDPAVYKDLPEVREFLKACMSCELKDLDLMIRVFIQASK